VRIVVHDAVGLPDHGIMLIASERLDTLVPWLSTRDVFANAIF